jgi:hypothetical protein
VPLRDPDYRAGSQRRAAIAREAGPVPAVSAPPTGDSGDCRGHAGRLGAAMSWRQRLQRAEAATGVETVAAVGRLHAPHTRPFGGPHASRHRGLFLHVLSRLAPPGGRRRAQSTAGHTHFVVRTVGLGLTVDSRPGRRYSPAVLRGATDRAVARIPDPRARSTSSSIQPGRVRTRVALGGRFAPPDRDPGGS